MAQLKISKWVIAGSLGAVAVGVCGFVVFRSRRKLQSAVATPQNEPASDDEVVESTPEEMVEIAPLQVSVPSKDLMGSWSIALVHDQYPMSVVQFQCSNDVSRPQLNIIVEDLNHNTDLRDSDMSARSYIAHSMEDLMEETHMDSEDEDVAYFEFTQPMEQNGHILDRRLANQVIGRQGVIIVVQLLCRDESWSWHAHLDMYQHLCKELSALTRSPDCVIRRRATENFFCCRFPSRRDQTDGFSCLVPVQRYEFVPVAEDPLRSLYGDWPKMSCVMCLKQQAAFGFEAQNISIIQFSSKTTYQSISRKVRGASKSMEKDVVKLMDGEGELSVGLCPEALVMVLVRSDQPGSPASQLCRFILQSIGPHNGPKSEIDFLHRPSGFRYRFQQAEGITPKAFTHFFGSYNFEYQPEGAEDILVKFSFTRTAQTHETETQLSALFPRGRQTNRHNTHEGWQACDVLIDGEDGEPDIVVHATVLEHLGFTIHVCWMHPIQPQADAYVHYTSLQSLRKSIVLL